MSSMGGTGPVRPSDAQRQPVFAVSVSSLACALSSSDNCSVCLCQISFLLRENHRIRYEKRFLGGNNWNFVLNINTLFLPRLKKVTINQITFLMTSSTTQPALTWSIIRHFIKFCSTFSAVLGGMEQWS